MISLNVTNCKIKRTPSRAAEVYESGLFNKKKIISGYESEWKLFECFKLMYLKLLWIAGAEGSLSA